MKTSIPLLWMIISLQLVSCQKEIVGVDTAGDPLSAFQQIWQDFDVNYGLFDVKKINWDSLYQIYSPVITIQSSPSELYQAITGMLSHLNDKHVTLFPASNPELPRWGIDLDQDGVYHNDVFDLEVVKKNYLKHISEASPEILYGFIGDKTGYLHILHLDAPMKNYQKAIDAAFKDFQDIRGLVIDLRDCAGGYDPNSQYVAGRFCSTKALYMTTRKKKGPAHDDFTETEYYYIEPTGKSQFNKPVIVLTSSITASAGETLLLALRTQNHIRQMGGITAGNFSDNPMWEASNGWSYTISVGDYRDASGQSYEAIGLSPDIEIIPNKSDLLAGKDLVLEKALQMLSN